MDLSRTRSVAWMWWHSDVSAVDTTCADREAGCGIHVVSMFRRLFRVWRGTLEAVIGIGAGGGGGRLKCKGRFGLGVVSVMRVAA